LSNVWHITEWEITIRLFLAAFLGGLIGLEREWNNHAAGFRTHILVCIASTSIMLLSIYGFSDFVNEANVRLDPSRLAAQVVSGIGFLGAGAIMRNGSNVTGLTTAASIWVVAAIGLCVGAGFYYCAGLSTLLVVLSLLVLNKLEKRMMRNRRNHQVLIKIHDRPGILGSIATKFGDQDLQIANLQMKSVEHPPLKNDSEQVMELRFSIKAKNPEKLYLALDTISKIEDVIWIESSLWHAFKVANSQAYLMAEQKNMS
jgi:putative Mg2+ transporter-C (MgtC) family protein